MRRARRRKWLGLMLSAILLAGIAAALWTLLFGPAATEPPAPGERALVADLAGSDTPSRVDYAALDARITALMQDPDMVGLAIGTVERGKVRFLKGYGETLAGSGDPITPDTVFRWASLSKGVASTLVVKLAEAGRLSLDAPVAGFGTTLSLPGGTRAVSVADLLAHRVGLPRNAWDDRLEGGQDPRMLRAQLGSLPPYCPPATCHSYQNIAYDAASEIVERTAKRGYADVARAELFAPLGMRSASMDRASLQGAASWARPHRRARLPTTVNDSYYRVPAAGGVNSSIRDLTRWMLAQMGQAPRIISPAALQTLHQARVPTPPHGRRGAMDRAMADPAYGLGWRSFHYAGHALVGHRGAVDGYRALILFDPAERSGIVLLWNSNASRASRVQMEFFDRLYGLLPTDWLELEPAVTTTGAIESEEAGTVKQSD